MELYKPRVNSLHSSRWRTQGSNGLFRKKNKNDVTVPVISFNSWTPSRGAQWCRIPGRKEKVLVPRYVCCMCIYIYARIGVKRRRRNRRGERERKKENRSVKSPVSWTWFPLASFLCQGSLTPLPNGTERELIEVMAFLANKYNIPPNFCLFSLYYSEVNIFCLIFRDDKVHENFLILYRRKNRQLRPESQDLRGGRAQRGVVGWEGGTSKSAATVN